MFVASYGKATVDEVPPFVLWACFLIVILPPLGTGVGVGVGVVVGAGVGVGVAVGVGVGVGVVGGALLSQE